MNDGKISVRYANALFQSALEKNLLDKVYKDMTLILEVTSVPEFRELLESPIIRPSKKREVIQNTIGGNIDKLTASLIDLIVKNGRENFLPGITREFIRAYKEYNGITELVLTTAVKVNEDVKKRIADLIAGIFKTKVELNEVIDRNIIGGFILKVEDNYIDASVRNKLRKIEKELKSGALTI
ncbi:MAG TPA: ATP synthase F1 subunit delta [Bacteroidales bacterium]|nr:ATP synthase F1 subunit delta [Bacteroidales bacterium]